jgi:GntR family transcriptional regulator
VNVDQAPRLVAADRPRYDAVYREIAEEIAKGSLQPGDRLPVERALCERFGVSRATVRRALRTLAAEGLVELHVRRGAFVASGRLTEPSNVLLGFSEMAAARGYEISTKVLNAQVRQVGMVEADLLQIAPGADIFELERLRLIEDRPIVFDHSRLPLARTAGVETVDYTKASLFETLEDVVGVSPARADYTITAISAATEDYAELLAADPDLPLLHVDDMTYDDAGVLICVSMRVYRGDRWRFHSTLHRPASIAAMRTGSGGG